MRSHYKCAGERNYKHWGKQLSVRDRALYTAAVLVLLSFSACGRDGEKERKKETLWLMLCYSH